jgi:hypothetical protein
MEMNPCTLTNIRRCRVTAPVPVAALLAVLLTACDRPPANRADGAEPPQPALQPPGVVDWEQRVVTLSAEGWTLQFCEGDGPFLCVGHDGAHVGSVELLGTPVQDHALIAGVLARGGGAVEALQAAAEQFVAALEGDRRTGIGAEYRLRRETAAPADVMGTQGLHLVVEGHVGDRIQERIVHYYAILGDTLYLLGATGMEGGGSLGEFPLRELRAFEPVLSSIAAASRGAPTS